LLKQEISFSGQPLLNHTSDAFWRAVPFSSNARHLFESMLADGEVIEVKVEGWKAVHYALASDAEVLEFLVAGRAPDPWSPLETTTSEEAVFLAPLDQVSSHGRG
jgi:uncharacterized protein